jgi:hypothetical protein
MNKCRLFNLFVVSLFVAVHVFTPAIGSAQSKKKEKPSDSQKKLDDGPEFFKQLKLVKGNSIRSNMMVYDVARFNDLSGGLTEEEYEKVCRNVEKNQSASVTAAGTCFNVVTDYEAFDFVQQNGVGVVSGYKINWDAQNKICRMSVNISGIKNGSTFARSTSCRISGFVIKDDGSVIASSGQTAR